MKNIKTYKEFKQIFENDNLDSSIIPTKEEYRSWVNGDVGEGYEIDIKEEHVNMAAKIAFFVATQEDMIDEDDIQTFEKDIDYDATMNDFLSFADEEEQEKIIELGNDILDLSKEKRDEYFKSIKVINKFKL